MKLNAFLTATLIAGAVAVTLPSVAKADHSSERISDRLYHIEARIEQLRDIYSPYERLDRINRLQRRLHKLEYRSDELRGRRARENDRWIDVLQRRLYRIERRTKYRLSHRYDYRDGYAPHPHRTYHAPDVIVPQPRGHGSVVISGSIGFPIHHY